LEARNHISIKCGSVLSAHPVVSGNAAVGSKHRVRVSCYLYLSRVRDGPGRETIDNDEILSIHRPVLISNEWHLHAPLSESWISSLSTLDPALLYDSRQFANLLLICCFRYLALARPWTKSANLGAWFAHLRHH
jgi:hypothetical protein